LAQQCGSIKMINEAFAKKCSTVIHDQVIMIESGHSLPDLRDVEEYHDDRKIEKIYRRFRFLNNPVSPQFQKIKHTLISIIY